ncbi:dedicator of cytokinesis protein 9 isoform X3 [Cryptotermes secundus]|uniref:dedicator of cytokinesis protein 9 isoform X3 n=1 Tax=Cryptotermes secundus TaxID=105785 RepID=UPI000CD7AFC6|nr:dedicator of cytokinesis protein 9 isoform X3 [Cryptotermes secundus]
MTCAKMGERKFTRGLGKPGMAAQLRETVSQVVRESTVQNKPQLVEPIDFETFILKNKTLLQNDPQRELLLYPSDDVSQVVLPRRFRTTVHSVPAAMDATDCSLFTKECLKTYTSNWNLIHYKYSAYSGTYLELPKILKSDELKDEVYEVDTDADQVDEDLLSKNDCITKQGYLMKGPEVGSDRMFVNIGSKSFKRRYCYLRQEVDGTYILELHKDEKKGEAKATIVMDFCTEVVRNSKRGRFCFELRMTAGHKSYSLAAENELELQDWLSKLNSVLQQNKVQEEKRAASLERASNTPPPSPQPSQMYGTLKGLEQSMNPQLIKYARETDVSIALARRENRRRLFSVYPHMPHVKNGSTNYSEHGVEPYREQFGQRLQVCCESIRFRLQAPIDGEKEALCQVEPYFTTLALFDAKQGRKLTENFHFDVNHPQVRNMVPCISKNGAEDKPETLLPSELQQVPEEWLMYPKQAVLSISNPHPDIFVVVKIDKILQGGICQTTEPYIRSTKDPRLGLRVHKTVKTCCQRLGNYRMPFAWTARPLFRLYTNELDTSDFPAVYRQEGNRLRDEEILRILSEFRKPDKMSRLTVIPGWVKIRIEQITELPENSLTASLSPLKPFPMPPTNEPTIEVMEFEGTTEKDVHPYTTFLNHLYVYPQSLAFDTQKTFTRARNIACIVELMDSDAEGAHPLCCLYGRPGGPVFVHQISCTVLHHSTTPAWYEEIKLKLPIHLHNRHHLLFKFYHISCEPSKKKESGIETCVGYAWLPLLHRGRLNVEEQVLPVASHLPPGYLSVQPLGLGKGVMYSGPEISWIDGQRQIFSVNFQLVSTVVTRDQHLHNLFAHTDKMLEHRGTSAPPSETEICKILKATHAIQLPTAVTFLPTLLNHLFSLLVATSSEEIGLNIIRVLIHIIHMVHQAGRKEILQAYVKFVFVTPNVTSLTTVHEEMSRHLPTLLRPANTDFLVINKFMHHSNFFFDIMVKSMAQHLLSSGRIKMHRNERFTADFLYRIQNLLQVLCPYLIQKYKEMPVETQELNRSLANFLKKCLTFMDRGYVFKLINSYMDKFNPGDPKTLYDYKFAFLQIICSHEHYVAFNLPLLHPRMGSRSRNDYMSEYCLSEEFCKQHFLVGLLLQEVRTSLNEVFQIRKVAVSTLRDLLAKHELDDRYQNKGQLGRIAAVYIPWLGIVLDNLNRLNCVQESGGRHTELHHMCSSSSRFSDSSSFLNLRDSGTSAGTPKSLNRFTMHLDGNSSARASIHFRDSSYFSAIAGQALVNGSSSVSLESESSTVSGDGHSTVSQETAIIREPKEEPAKEGSSKRHSRSLSVTHSNQPVRCDKLQSAEVKDLLLCFLFVVKYLGDDCLIAWWHQCTETEVMNFFKGLEMCLHQFKYTGKRQIAGKAGGKPGTTKAMTLPARMQPPDFSGDSPVLPAHSGSSSVGRDGIQQIVCESDSSKLYQALLEANMATEVGLIALDALGLYCINFKDNLLASEGDNIIMKKVFDIYLSFLQVGQSETLFRHVFAALRAYINNFSIALFQGNASLCGRLCYELLRCCNSRLSTIRQESCAILYLLMRSNFEFTSRKGLTRVHLQVIISVSQMLGNVIGLNNARFQESLSLINSYASSDKVMKGTGFPGEVKDLTKRIRTVLMATAQMREHHHDPEMLVDLQHSLANSYASTPELRHTWLETMARNHVRDGNFSEAASCQLHIAALMAEYLKLKSVQSWGAEAFSRISSNIAQDERSLKLDAGVQDIQYTEYILLEQLEKCAEYLEKAERYELLGELYRLIIPMHERKHNYEALAQCYQSLAQAYSKIVEVSRTGKRLLGRYYRVAFFGQAYFEEDSGVEYVYKEPKVTSLSEISERLYHLYCDKFGQDVVKIIMDSVPINRSELDAKYAYIQVTHVTPYFEKLELEERQTEFEQSHDIKCFMFETPFTMDGKARGTPEDQWKRRTILTTRYSFPYVTKRICVVKQQVQELSPIEVALDEMQMRVNELEEVVFMKPTDAKKLQLRLQGSVCVQVNAGPLTYASVFLDPSQTAQYPEDKVEDLKDVFREFVKICYTALQINSKLITSDQHEYQEVLRQNFQKLCHNLSSLFGESLWPDEEVGCFKRNSQALFSVISGASGNSSSA